MLAKRFTEALSNLSGKESASKVARVIKSIVEDGQPTNGTKMVRYSQIKKFLETEKPQLVRYLKVPKKLLLVTLQDQKQALETREPLDIDDKWVRVLRGWSNSGNPYQILAHLQFVSGRRISEIYSTHFRTSGSNITTRGLRKKRNDDSLCSFTLLFNTEPKWWTKKLHDVRKQLGNDSLGAVTKTVNRALRHIDVNLTSHKLRGIYANVKWLVEGKPEPKTEFIKDSLCLSSEDVAAHYAKFNVADLKIK